MAFLYKVFSWSERLKDSQKSAEIVNKTFQEELKNVQSSLQVENDELQMLVDMIYDSSFPETQKFLKDPSKDRLHSHTETISSLLFGLAAQGVAVAPLILTHFQKYGYEAIADTLTKLLELVRPLLASKDAPEFTSDDILDAIDVQWHSSVKTSPAFGSLRGSIPPSPLQSPRGSFSTLSPRGSISSPRNSFSMHYSKVVGSPGVQIPSEIISPRRTRSYSISPPSSLPGAGWDGAGSTPPRRSFSSRIPSSDGNLSLPYGERLQPLAEQDEENNHGSSRFRKHDDSIMASLSQIEDDKDSALRLNLETEQKKSLDANIPRRPLPLEVSGNSELESAGGTQVADKQDIYDVACVKSTSVPIPLVDKSGGEDDEDNDVWGAKTFGAPNSVSYDSSTAALGQRNVMSVVDSSHAKEVGEETPELLVRSSLTGSSGHVQELVKFWTSSGQVLEGAPGMLNEKNFESEAAKGIHSEKVPLLDQAPTLESTQVQQFTEELSSPVRKTTEVEQESRYSAKQTESKHIEDESCMSNVGVSDNAQIDMGKADEITRKVVPEVIGSNNVAVDCVEGDIADHEYHSSTLPSSSSDASDKLFASIAIKDKEESSKLCLDPTEGSLPGEAGTLSEGEVESREQESLDLRQGQENVEAITDILDSSPALDSEDSDDDNRGNSSSSSSFSQNSSSSSSPTSDDESTSISSTSSEKGESLSNSDDDTDDERCMTSLRQQGTEEVAQSVPVKDFLEDGTILSHAQDEESTLPLGNGTSELCSTIDVDTNEVPGTEETGSVPCDNNPELDLEPGAELLTPSYNLMTFDSDEDRSSDLSVESEDNSIPDGMSENEVITEPTSHDGLHMILVNYITGSRPTSPKELPPLTNTTANGTSLPSSSSQNHQEDVIKVVASSAIDGSTDAGTLSHDALELKLPDGFPSEKMEKTEASVVTNSAILLSDDKDLEGNEEHLFADVVSGDDSEVVVTDCEGELSGALAQNEMEVDFPTKDCEPRSIDGNSLSSIPSGEEDHGRDFLAKEDLVTGGSDIKELDAAGIETPEISTGIEEGHTSSGHPNEHITNTGEDEPYLVEGKNPRQEKDEEVGGYSMINSQEEVWYGIENKFLDSGCNQQTDPLNGYTVSFSTDAATNGSLEGAVLQGSPPSKTSTEIDSVALPSYVQEEGDNDTRYILEESRFARSRESLPDTALEQAVRVESRSSRRSNFEQDDSLRDVNAGQSGHFKVKGGIEVTLPVKATEEESGGESYVLKNLETSDAGNLPGSVIAGSNDTELSLRTDGDQQFPQSEYLDRNKMTSEEHREPELIQRESLKSISADLIVTTAAVQFDRQLQPVGEDLHMICETPKSSTQEEEKVDFTPHSDFTLLPEPEELFLAEDKGAELAGIEYTAPSNSHEEKMNSSLKHCRNEELEGKVNKTSGSETKDVLGGAESDGGNNLLTERGNFTGVVDLEPALNPVKTETSPSSLEVDDVEQDENLCRVAKDTGATTATSGNENDCVFTFSCQRPVDSSKLLSEEDIDVPGSSMLVHSTFKQPVTSVSANNSLLADIVSVEDCKEVTHSEEIEGQEDKSFTKCGAASQISQQINDVSEHPENHASIWRDFGEEERWDEKRPLKLSNNTIAIPERLEWDTPETTYKTSKLSLGGHESAANRGEQPLDSVSLQKEQEMSIKVAEVEKSSKLHFENEGTGETCKQVNDNQNTRLSDALVTTPADKNERIYQNEEQQKRKGDDISMWPSELSKEEKTQMTSGRNTDCDEKEVLAGSFIGSIHNLTFIDSRGDPVSAISVPTTIPSPVKVNSSRTIANLSHSDTMEKHAVYQDDRSYLSGGEKEAKSPTRNGSDFDEAAVMFPVHSNTATKASFVPNAPSVRDSIICNSSSSESSFQTEKRVIQRRRFMFVRTLCCSCCSKPSTL